MLSERRPYYQAGNRIIELIKEAYPQQPTHYLSAFGVKAKKEASDALEVKFTGARQARSTSSTAKPHSVMSVVPRY